MNPAAARARCVVLQSIIGSCPGPAGLRMATDQEGMGIKDDR